MVKNKILVVDDEPNIRKVIKARLEANDYEVITASDGEEAVIKFHSENPDLIILDVRMPKKDGFQVLEELRKGEPAKWRPIIMLTAENNPKNIFKGYQNEADLYVVKPFEWEKLISNVQTLLSLSLLREDVQVKEDGSILLQAIEKKDRQEQERTGTQPSIDVSQKAKISHGKGVLPPNKTVRVQRLSHENHKYHYAAGLTILLLTAVWVWWHYSSKRVLKEMDTPKQIKSETLSQPLLEVEKAGNKVEVEDKKPLEEIDYIYYESGIKMAVINGRAVEIGDKVDGAIVKDISKDNVVMEKDDITYVLKWEKSKVNK